LYNILLNEEDCLKMTSYI